MPLREISDFTGVKLEKELYDYALNCEDNYLDNDIKYNQI
jgi:hypothetical protein